MVFGLDDVSWVKTKVDHCFLSGVKNCMLLATAQCSDR